MVLRSINTASTPMPTRAKGSEMSQTKGETISASSASGQLTASRINQATKNRSIFTVIASKT